MSALNRIKKESIGIENYILEILLKSGVSVDTVYYVIQDSAGFSIYTEVGFLDSSGVVYLKVGDMLLLDHRLEPLLGKYLKQNALSKIIFIHEFKCFFNNPKNLLYTITALAAICNMDLRNKTVLDLGCAEGVLGLMAIKKGSARVFGVDIDKRIYSRFYKNRKINGISKPRLNFINSKFKNKDYILDNIPKDKIDIVFANIGPHYRASDLEAFSLLKFLPMVKSVVAGGYSNDDPAFGFTRALFKLGEFGFSKKLKYFYPKNGFHTAFLIGK